MTRNTMEPLQVSRNFISKQINPRLPEAGLEEAVQLVDKIAQQACQLGRRCGATASCNIRQGSLDSLYNVLEQASPGVLRAVRWQKFWRSSLVLKGVQSSCLLVQVCANRCIALIVY